MKIRKYLSVAPLVGALAMSGLIVAACDDDGGGGGSGDGDVGGNDGGGEGEGEAAGPGAADGQEGEGEGQAADDGAGDGGGGEGEGEGQAADDGADDGGGEGEGEGEGEGGDDGPLTGEGEGEEPVAGEGEGEGDGPDLPSAAVAFCDTYLVTCEGVDNLGHVLPAWVEDGTCEAWYDAAPPSPATPASNGATQGCYEYHLGAAQADGDRGADGAPTASQTTHCPHAGGAPPCAD